MNVDKVRAPLRGHMLTSFCFEQMNLSEGITYIYGFIYIYVLHVYLWVDMFTHEMCCIDIHIDVVPSVLQPN